MISLYSLLYTLVLFSELSGLSATAALPAAKAEDNAAEQYGLGLLLRDEPMAERAAVPQAYRRSVPDNNVEDEEESPKIIFVSDMRLKGHGVRGLNPFFTRSFPLLTDQSVSYNPAEPSLKIDRRDTKLDMLRCMIGRVYRPCWEV
ncbi:pro-MCH [Labrus mixtus]|uniref:pro-MCH n=1 Tax=Labrus mixtus TaxID=508554 RepID=UPI0029C0D3D4|nr:pro-MCH [Labrus mixtus]